MSEASAMIAYESSIPLSLTLISLFSTVTIPPLAKMPLEVELIVFSSTIVFVFCRLIPAVIGTNESSDEEFPKLSPKALIVFLYT